MKFGTLSSKLQAMGRNLKRFWPMPVFYGLFLLLVLSGEYINEPSDLWRYSICSYGIFMSLYGIVCAILLSGDLFTARYATAVHSLPVTREGLFLGNLLTGLAMLLLPMVPAFLLALAMADYSLVDALRWACPQLVMGIYGYTVGALGCILSGTVFGSIAMTGLLVLGIPMAEGLLREVIGGLYVGMPKDSNTVTAFLAPVIKITEFYGDGISWDYFWWVLAACVPLLAVAVLLYRKRELEVAGDFVAFPKTKPYIKGCATVLIGLALGMIFNGIFLWDMVFENRLLNVLLWLVPGVLVARVATEMVVEKTVREVSGKHLLRYGLCVLMAAGLTTLVWLDIPGVQTRVPDPEDVASLEIDQNWNDSFLLEQPENIATATELHKALTENPQYDTSSSAVMDTRVKLTYTMKNGSVICREYRLNYGSDYMADPPQIYYDVEEFYHDPDIAFALMMEEEYAPEKTYEGLRQVFIRDCGTNRFYYPELRDVGGLLDAIYEDLVTGGAYVNEWDFVLETILYSIEIHTESGSYSNDEVCITDPDGAVARWIEENLPELKASW